MGYSSAQAKDFINYIAPMIKEEGKARGYKIFSTVIAQAIVESAAGTSWISKEPYWNFFGMKCGTTWKGRSVNAQTKEEYTKGTLTTIKANFRAYNSDVEGVKGYYDFIKYKRFENLKTASDYKQYAEFLSADGYATSSKYTQTLINTVEKYNLTKWDDVEAEQPVPQHIQKRRVLKFVLPFMQGSDVVLCQQILKKMGYDLGSCGVDGKYGRKTSEAVAKFQSENGLQVDSIVGSCTWAMLEKYNQ